MSDHRDTSLYARRSGYAINLALLLLGVVVIVVSMNVIAASPSMRFTADATRTRAYSLSDQTQSLLANLEGDWTLALVLDESQIDPRITRQVNEVIQRLDEAAPKLTVMRLGDSSARTLADFESLIARLEMIYADEVLAYTRALDDGEAAFADLLAFAGQTAIGLDRLVAAAPESLERNRLAEHARQLARLAAQGETLQQQIDAMRTVTDTRAIPDYDGARSTLAALLTNQSGDLSDMATRLDQWRQRPDVSEIIRQYASNATGRYRTLAQQLLSAADPLRRLEPLALSDIGTALQNKQAAVILSPDRATVIPAQQLFPVGIIDAADSGEQTVQLDQRFRGEQIIAASIRAITVAAMPRVIFTHAEETSLLVRRDRNGADLTAMADALRAARFEVDEWIVTQGDRPAVMPDQPVVYVVIPPSFAQSARGTTAAERTLINEVDSLITSGESVLLNIGPSLLAALGQSDPWARSINDTFSIVFDTESVLVRGSPGEDRINILGFQTRSGQSIFGQSFQRFDSPHPIAAALNGQQLFLPLPIAIEPGAGTETILAIEPDPNIWRDDIQSIARGRATIPEDRILTDPASVIVAASRTNPIADQSQRVLAVGSANWMFSTVAAEQIALGGERTAKLNPGNTELMLASIAWLAGMDDLIAPSPLSRQVARLTNLTTDARTTWVWWLRAGMPALCILLGGLVWAYRRWF